MGNGNSIVIIGEKQKAHLLSRNVYFKSMTKIHHDSAISPTLACLVKFLWWIEGLPAKPYLNGSISSAGHAGRETQRWMFYIRKIGGV